MLVLHQIEFFTLLCKSKTSVSLFCDGGRYGLCSHELQHREWRISSLASLSLNEPFENERLWWKVWVVMLNRTVT